MIIILSQMYKKQSIKLYKKLSNAKPFFLICGPCMIESEKITLNIAEKINNIKNTFNIPIIFKSKKSSIIKLFLY